MDILNDLFNLMESRCERELVHTPEYQMRYREHEQMLSKVQQTMGETFRVKLDKTLLECTELDIQAAFAWGLRLGLALHNI